MKLDKFEEFNENSMVKEVIFKNKRNPNLVVKIIVKNLRIDSIDKSSMSIRFPFRIGQMFNRTMENWACSNNYLMNDKDVCGDKKVFGIKTKDIPMGHEFRKIYPNKFR